MPTIELNIEARMAGIEKAIEGLGTKINKINQKTIKPIDAAAIDKEAEKSVKIVERHNQRVIDAAEKHGRKVIEVINKTSQAQEDAADEHRTHGKHPETQYHIRRHRFAEEPEWSEVGEGFMEGVGGGFARVTGKAISGGKAGMAEGGAKGAAAGFLRGGAIGAGIFAAMKIGEGLNEGYDLATERARSVDTLKRQMGDVGVSFERLKIATDSAATSLGISTKDFAAIEQKLNIDTRGDQTPQELAEGANITSGFARAYAMDPMATAGIFSAQKNLDPKQQYRDFAGILAQTIERTGKSGAAEEVSQAVLSFSQSVSRLSLSVPNIGGFAGAYSQMYNAGAPGMTSAVSEGILAQANSAMSNMGAAGEAGQAFTMAAFNRRGRQLNPLEVMGEASGGLFGSRATTFAADTVNEKGETVINSQFGHAIGVKAATRLSTGPGSETTNLEMIQKEAEAQAGGRGPLAKEMQAEMLMRYFGLSSMQQAMSIASLKHEDLPGFGPLLQRAGVDAKDLNFLNIQTVAKIGGKQGQTREGLNEIYDDLKNREGSAALTGTDKENINKARDTGTIEQYQDALVKASATKDYAQGTYNAAMQTAALMEDLKMKAGDMMLAAVSEFQSTVVSLLGGRKNLREGQIADVKYTGEERQHEIEARYKEAARKLIDEQNKNVGIRSSFTPETMAKLEALDKKEKAELAANDKKTENEVYKVTHGMDENAQYMHEYVVHIHPYLYVDDAGHVRVSDKMPTTVTVTPSGKPKPPPKPK
jgi:hypothetical protein